MMVELQNAFVTPKKGEEYLDKPDAFEATDPAEEAIATFKTMDAFEAIEGSRSARRSIFETVTISEEFEALVKDPEVQSAQEKILSYEITQHFPSERLPVPQLFHDTILKKAESAGNYRVFFASLSTSGIDFSKRFDDLSVEQKVKYIALHEVAKKSDFKDVKQFHQQLLAQEEKVIDKCFKSASNQQSKDLYQIDSVLKKYNLTPEETLQFKRFLELLQKHPEYNREQLAGVWGVLKLLFVLGVFAAGWFGHKRYAEWKNPSTKLFTESGTLGNVEEIFDVMLSRRSFTQTGSIRMDQRKQLGYGGILGQGADLLVDIGNFFQNVTIHKTIRGEHFLKYDLSNATVPQYIKEVKTENGRIEERKLIYFYIPEKPELTSYKTGGNVNNRSNELISNSDFRNAEETLDANLLNEAKQRVLNDIGYDRLLAESNSYLCKQLQKIYEADGSQTKVILQVGGPVKTLEDLAREHNYNLQSSFDPERAAITIRTPRN